MSESTINVIYSCCVGNPWVEISKDLAVKGFKATYIIHWRDERREFEGSGAYLQSVEDAWRGEGFPELSSSGTLDEFNLSKVSRSELLAIKMMDRLDPDGSSFSFGDRQYFFRDLLRKWLCVLHDRDVSLVISPSVPHRVFDYALYVACEIKGIPYLSFQMTPFGSNSIIINNIDDMPVVGCSELLPSAPVKERIDQVMLRYDVAEPDYMKAHKKNNSSVLKPILKIASSVGRNYREGNYYKLRSPNTYWVAPGGTPDETPRRLGWVSYFTYSVKRRWVVKRYQRAYESLVSSRGRVTGDYVLVALHYQPEETSCPSAGVYVDQLLMVQLLLDALPKDVSLLVKEHRSQFYPDQEGASGRTDSFYRRLSKLSNRVTFSGVNDNPFELIDKAYAVATLTGTIGWESAIRGRPAFHFGRAWYQGMPNTYRIKNVADIKSALIQIAENCVESKDSLLGRIYSFHAALEGNFICATHYKAFVGRGDVTLDESRKNIVKGICQYFEAREDFE